MRDRLYTAAELLKRFKGRYIRVYPRFYEAKDKQGKWVTLYEVTGVKRQLHEDYNLPEDAVIAE